MELDKNKHFGFIQDDKTGDIIIPETKSGISLYFPNHKTKKYINKILNYNGSIVFKCFYEIFEKKDDLLLIINGKSFKLKQLLYTKENVSSFFLCQKDVNKLTKTRKKPKFKMIFDNEDIIIELQNFEDGDYKLLIDCIVVK
jgi:hypothetical protein